ncbi:NLI interacting factor-like phosphatase family protein, putative [Ichthyophthirius multifiliis]|uniref:Mitochondrial import inner membrane translocase subunit TIM50 n=1 Tax=Ichthyophthirius multifiliis TaxID=5932 RepID=G0QV13_ICHMU|nr:NLI interacting factor-like phosphatase family protein, putative [Ichthyophthirius multifiliis]EGR30938.1 NLI interacting factor-like phosphatase family protein, putative [Ichthyophthirius multifiliis]|eukprot:XP_004032525.1 NLI interacting factor-like phosphatase family protein, putative [Ichthyophthirius multifiliis]
MITEFRKYLSLIYRGLIYSTKCLRGPSDQYIQTKQVELQQPKKQTGNTLFLDLDETLIHSCSLNENPDVILKVGEINEPQFHIGFRIRPYCMDFLKALVEYWDIYIFTASSSTYSNAIINYLDPERKYINGILNRSNCMETKNGFFIKDLRIAKGKDLRKIILVDNLSHSFGFQIDNGIPILEWHHNKYDEELKHLTGYLIEASQVEDIRVFNRQKLKLQELIKNNINDL